MNTIQEIDAQIAELQRQHDDVEGTPTEIYTRIVGYYRSLKNWNRGKREEYDHRQTFSGQPAIDEITRTGTHEQTQTTTQEVEEESVPFTAAGEETSFLYFYRISCPNCPPVRKELEDSGLTGEMIDVDTESGIAKAVEYQVLATPTVVLLNSDQTIRAKLSSIERLRSALQMV